MESEKKKRFCEEFVIDLNGSAAAIRAGYSEKTSRQKAYELLNETEVQEYIKKLQNKIADKSLDLAERITKEWEKLAFTSIAHLHNTWVERKEFETLTEDQKAAIESIETKTITAFIDGAPKLVEYVKIKLFDKTKALTELGKHVGYYSIDNKQKSANIVIQVGTDDQKQTIDELSE